MQLLLRSRSNGALRGCFSRGHDADLGAVLVLDLGHDRGPVQQALRRGGLQQLEGGVDPAGHVVLDGDGADRGLVLPENLLVPLGVLLRDRRLCPGLGELDLQPVVLLAQRVDLL